MTARLQQVMTERLLVKQHLSLPVVLVERYMKGFDLSAMFNFVYGNKIYNADKIVTSQTYTATTNFSNLQSYMNSSNRYTYLDAKRTDCN